MTPEETLRQALLEDKFPESDEKPIIPIADPLKYNRMTAVSAWMGNLTGQDISPEDIGWQAEKDALAQSFFKMPDAKDVSDETVHDLIRSHIQTSDNATDIALNSALTGRPLAQTLNEIQALAGVSKTRGIRDRYVSAASSLYSGIAPKRAQYNDVINEVSGILSKEMQFAIPTTDAFQSVADKILQVPEEDRRIVIEAIGATGGATAEERSSYLNKVAATFGRYSEMLGGRSESMVETIAGTIEQIANAPVEIATLLSGGSGMGIQAEVAGAGARSKAALAERDRVRELQLLTDNIRKIALQKVDPIKGNNWVEQLGLDLTGMIPQTAIAVANPAIGYAANLAYFRDDIASKFKNENPNATTAQADNVATKAAPLNAAWETVTALIPFGKVKLPFIQKWLMAETASVGGALRNFGIRAGVGTATEISEEWLQAYTPLKVQELMRAMGQDMPAVDWERNMPKFADIAAEVWAPALVFSIVGAGAASINDINNGRRLASDLDLLIARGIAPETAAKIKEASDLGDYNKVDSLFREEFVSETKASKPDIQAATERLKARFRDQSSIDVLQDATSPEYTAKVSRAPSGWQVTTGDGSVIQVSSAEAARRIAVDLRQVGSQEEADTLVGVIDSYYEKERKAETNLTGEKVMAEEIKAGEGRVFAERRDASGALISQRQFGPKALETVREEAEVAGIKSNTRGVFAHINGSNEVFPMRVADGAKEIVRRMNLYKSQAEGQPQVITFLHENFESTWQLGMANGTFSEQETRTAMRALLPAFEGVTALNTEEAQFINNLRTLASGKGNETMLRETVSEMVIRDVLGRDRQGRATGMKPGSISRAIEASVMGANTQEEASALKSILAAIKAFTAYLKGVFSTVDAMIKANEEGKIGAEYDTFINKVLGIDEVKQMESQAVDEVKAMLGVDEEAQAVIDAENMAFSTSRAQPADTSNVTEMPDGAQLVGPTTFSIEAYHGTPHEVDRFRTSKIGTGEGAQAFGWGLYFAKNKAVASQYTNAGREGATGFRIKGEQLTGDENDSAMIRRFDLSMDQIKAVRRMLDAIPANLQNLDEYIAELKQKSDDLEGTPEGDEAYSDFIDLSNLRKDITVDSNNLYTVELLPDEEEFISWDDSISKQSSVFESGPNRITGSIEFLANLSEGQALTPQYLSSLDVPRYADMLSSMFSAAQYFKIDGPIVGLIPVDVVDFLRLQKLTPQDLLHNKAMLTDLLAATAPNVDVAVWVNESSVAASAKAKQIAEKLGASSLAGLSEKLIAANKTGAFNLHHDTLARLGQSATGKEFYDEIVKELGSEKAASEYLASLGIPGIRYLDGGSRAAGEGTSNYVIFDENLVKIIEKNGQKVENSGQSFSISPVRNLNELSDQVARQFAENPVEALEVKSRMIRQFAKISDKWSNERWTPQGNKIRPISEKRTVKSLDKEQAMRQATLEGEKIAANMEAGQALKEAKAEAQAWRDETDAMQKEDWSPKESLVRDLITLEAIRAVFPQEIRDKIGGFVALARKASEAARLKVLQKQLERGQALLEKHLKEQYNVSLLKMLDKAAPVGKPGEIKKSKFIVTVQDELDAISEIVGMDSDDVTESITTNEAAIISAQTPEAADVALTRLNLLELFGGILDLKRTSSQEMEVAHEYLAKLMKQGREARKIIDEARSAKIKEMVATAKADAFKGQTGPETTQAARAKAAKESGMAMLKKFFSELSGFDAVLRDAFGPQSETARSFSERFTLNSNDFEDVQNERRTRFRDFARELYQTKFGAKINQKLIKLERIENNSGVTYLKNREVKSHKFTEADAAKIVADPKAFGFTDKDAAAISEEIQAIQNSGGRRKVFTYDQIISNGERVEIPLSQMDAVYISMALRQPGILEQQERHGYDQQTVDELDKYLTDEAKAWRRWMQTEYDAEYQRANEVYMRMFNARMPMIMFYAPLLKNHQGQQAILDPLNTGISSNSANPGSIKTRKGRTSSLRIESALTVFWAHFNQMEYWIANAEYLRDVQAVLLNPEVRESVVASHGEDGMATISAWIQLQMSRGVGKAALVSAGNKIFRNIKSGLTMKSLALSYTTALKTLPSVFYSLGEIHMSKWPAALVSGMKHWDRLWKTNIIQRRLDIGGMPELRDLGSSAMPMSWMNQLIRYGSFPAMYADGVFTTFSAAMAYGVNYDEAIRQGASEELAHKHAEERTALIVSRTAQPENWTQKSLFENDVGIIGSIYTLFMSDPRQKMALTGEALNYWRKGSISSEEAMRKTLAYWIIPGVMFQLANAIGRSLFKGDDDEWEVVDFATAALVGQLQGLVLLGSAAEVIFSAAIAAAAEKITGEEVKRKPFWNSSKNPLDQAAQDLKKSVENLNDTDKDVFEKTWEVIKSTGMLTTWLNPAGAVPATVERVIKDTTNLFYGAEDQ